MTTKLKNAQGYEMEAQDALECWLADIPSPVLAAIVRGDVDAVQASAWQLAWRGQDENGTLVGFEQPAKMSYRFGGAQK